MEVLRQSGTSKETLIALQTDVEQVQTTPRERALLALAATLTREPPAAGHAVRQALAAGWSTGEVTEAVFLVSMYNMVNRVADAWAFPPDEAHPYDPAGSVPVLSCPSRGPASAPR